MDKSRVEPTLFFIEKISFSLKLFSGHFYGQSFIKTVRGPLILWGYNVDKLNICMEELIIFVCTDSTEIFFSKLRSAGLNYNLPSFFTESYCAGVSNKHCLLTFFITSAA